MKRNVILTVIGCLMSVMAWGEQVVVETKNMTMVLDVEQGKHPQYVYFGSKLNAEELAHLQKPVEGRMMPILPMVSTHRQKQLLPCAMQTVTYRQHFMPMV